MNARDEFVYWCVTGKVQGVGFRWFVSREARALNVNGWVRNSDSGDVHVLASGTPEQIGELKRRITVGPPRSRVDRIEDMTSDPPSTPDTPFSIIP